MVLELVSDRNCQIAVLGRNLVSHIKNTKVIANGNGYLLVELESCTQAQSEIKTLETIFTEHVLTVGLAEKTDAEVGTELAKECYRFIDGILIASMDRDIEIKRIQRDTTPFATLEGEQSSGIHIKTMISTGDAECRTNTSVETDTRTATAGIKVCHVHTCNNLPLRGPGLCREAHHSGKCHNQN